MYLNDPRVRLEFFQNKLTEYFLHEFELAIGRVPTESNLSYWSGQKVNTLSIFDEIIATTSYSETFPDQLSDKLIDISFSFCYYRIDEINNLQTTLIVGKDNIEQLNPNTLEVLRRNHYRVYLISILFEQLLTVLYLIDHGTIFDTKNSKWEKLINSSHDLHELKFIDENAKKIILDFKVDYRRTELHGWSATRAFLNRDQWCHFQEQFKIAKQIVDTIAKEYSHDLGQLS